MKKIHVCVEWPGGGWNEEVEVEEDATQEEMEQAAADEFYNRCNYGWSEVEQAKPEVGNV
ncbi:MULTISPECIES: hypothetical protein [Xanthomonas]|uniref:Uncharacterized protein n=2 Tax=Xanthomonas TaxID=338 RepID=A0A7Z7NGN2_XANCH|nr:MULTISPECIES: hypothetical protein [Xanthomonas]ATS39297.1 hypothetical protein XcfCFBP6988P_15145 [Xanthomonas citri pv. phaseoli var. fuscans]ATS41896.1 hypothetical protein XcfCFBP6989P_05345 [Xanthomonas citri pv. phaseoli var. fuscans]ATS47300.1 hypothetical protein XcfCFBP6990P_12015 [Xanthomonas citri pv. phaseoli var. fuscans]ATS86321.1 hypothetical protein XcfCFBP6991P_22215 [Xanthomonas citri pv. phaseoli var. fuscans]QWN20941.1 hypothetical protein DGM98_13080 [Xanthomonas citri]